MEVAVVRSVVVMVGFGVVVVVVMVGFVVVVAVVVLEVVVVTGHKPILRVKSSFATNIGLLSPILPLIRICKNQATMC